MTRRRIKSWLARNEAAVDGIGALLCATLLGAFFGVLAFLFFLRSVTT